MRFVLAAALFLSFAFTAPASAQHRHHTTHYKDPRPHAWCGYYARHNLVSRDPGRDFNLARKWARWGINAGRPIVGAIVVWAHHVGKIVGFERGEWIVRSGNDGGRVRTRPRSLARAIAFRIEG